jgi:hypothetical protein
MFARKGILNLDGLEGSGADWLERFKPYIQDGKTIVVAPHRVFGPETNDLVLQLRKTQDQQDHPRRYVSQHVRRISLAGIARARFRSSRRERCNGCAKASRMGLGYEAALISYAFLAHAVLTTDQTVKAMEHGQP